MEEDKEEEIPQIFYSRNYATLKSEIQNVKDKICIQQVLLDYEYKKAVEYGSLSQSIGQLTSFTNLKHIVANFSQCALKTPKFLLLMRGINPLIGRIKSLSCIFDNNLDIGEEGINAFIKLFSSEQLNIHNILLSFKKCNINTDLCQKIILGISALQSKIISLNFESNQLQYNKEYLQCFQQLFLSSQNSLQLLEIIFSHNEFGDKILIDLSQSLIQINQLRVINLSFIGCLLQNDGLKKLSEILKNQSQLIYLSLQLDWNKISETGAEYIAEGIVNNKQLQYFNIGLDYNAIGQTGTEKILKSLEGLNQLTVIILNLAHNELGDEGAKSIGNNFPIIQSLKVLHLGLGWNKIQGEGAKKLIQRIEKMKNLESINLIVDNNQIGDVGVKQIAVSLLQFSNLQKLQLDLDDNGIGIESVQELVMSLSGIPLQGLSVNLVKNEINTKNFATLAQELLKNYPNLVADKLTLKSGITKQSNFGSQKLMALSGLSSSFSHFCEVTREKLPNEQQKILIQNSYFFSLMEELLPIPIIQILYEDYLEQKNNFINNLDQSLEKLNQTANNNNNNNNNNNAQINSNNNKSFHQNPNIEEIKNSNYQQESIIVYDGDENQQRGTNTNNNIKQGQQIQGQNVESQQKNLNQSSPKQNISNSTEQKKSLEKQNLQQLQQLNQSPYQNQKVMKADKSNQPQNQININNSTDQKLQQSQQLYEQQQQQQPQQQQQQQNINNISNGNIQVQPQGNGQQQIIILPQQILNDNDRSYIEVKQENIILKRENLELKKRLDQKYEPDIFVNMEKASNQLCQYLTISLKEYLKEKRLGAGSFGETYQVRRGNQLFALKSVDIDLKTKANYIQDLKFLLEQINDLTRSNKHKSIVYLYGISFNITESGFFRTNLLMELMSFDLKHYIKEKMNVDTARNLKIMKQILDVLVFLQENMMVHCGIKPSNILLDSEFNAKISDLAVQKIMRIQMKEEGESTAVHGFAPKYSAPEIFDGQENDSTDMWSYGCVLFQIFTGEPPWSGLTEYQQVRLMYQKVTILDNFKTTLASKNIKIHPKIEDIIQKCTSYANRLTAKEIAAVFPEQLD